MFRFEDQNTPKYNPEVSSLNNKTVYTQDELDDMTYGAMLSGNDPIAQYYSIQEEYKKNGESQFIQGLKQQINQETDTITRNVLITAIEDPSLSKEVKQQAVQDYYTKGSLTPSLRDTYAEYISSLYPKANPDPQAFVSGFFEKEVAAEQIDKELKDFGKELSGSTWEVFAEAAPWLAPLLRFNPYTAAIPIVADVRQGYLANKIAQAAQQKDFGFFKDVFNSLFKGEAVHSTREYLQGLPPKEKRDAIKRILAVVKDLPALDYEKYRYVQSFVETEDYGMLERLLDDSMILMDGALLGVAGKTAKREMQISPKSPLGTTATHNPTEAAKQMAAAITDDTGQIAKAFGETHSSIIGSILPKQADELVTGLSAEINPELLKVIEGVDEAGLRALTIASRNELLYPPELKDKVANLIYDSIKSAKGMAPHLGKSNVSSIEEAGTIGDVAFKGSVIFGKSSDSAFSSYDDALNAAETWLKETKAEGSFKIVRTDKTGKLVEASPKSKGDFYVQHEWNHVYHPMDLALWGENAVKINLPLPKGRIRTYLEDAASSIARGPLGRYLFAHHGISKRISDVAATSYDHALVIEKDFITQLDRYLAKRSSVVRSAVDDVIKEGEELGKTFNYAELLAKAKAKNFSKTDTEDLIYGYAVFRRIADWSYVTINNITKASMEANKVKHFKVSGQDIYGTRVPQQLAGTDVVWDIQTNTIKVLGKGDKTKGIMSELDQLYAKGGSLVKLHDPIRQGDNIVNYVMAGKEVTENILPQFVLPYIKGWAPRYAQNTYFVTRTPKNLLVDGKQVVNPDAYATTHAAANTKKEAERYISELSAGDSSGIYKVKRERTEANTILTDAKVYQQQSLHSKHRGEERLLGADNIDPLLGLHRLVKTLARTSAMDEFLTTFKQNFVRNYGKYTNFEFPMNRSAIAANTANMPLDEMKKLKEAFVHFDYYESLLLTSRFDQQAWRNAMVAVSTVAEPFGGAIAKTVKDVLKASYPTDLLRRLSTHLLISLNPVAQRFVQPSQVIVLPAYDSSLFNPNNFRKLTQQSLALKYGVNSYQTGTRLTGWIPDEVVIAVGSKLAGMNPAEYKQLVIDLKKTGLISSVDQNTIIEGVFSHADVPLKDGGIKGLFRKTQAAVSAVPAAGRKIGFDSGEQDNLIASYLTARKRLMKQRPELDVNSEYFKALTHADAREIAFSMNRAGAFAYQNNILAMPLQFITAPHKALLSMTTSKMLSTGEKARLFGLYIGLYGSYGTVAYGAVSWMREQLGNEGTPEMWSAIQGGILDWGANTLINQLLDEKDEHTELSLSARFSPLGGKFPFADFLEGLSEDPISAVFLGPSWSLLNESTGKIPRVLRQMARMYEQEAVTIDNIDDYIMKATEFTSGGSNWMKYRFAEQTGMLIAASGMPVEKQASYLEALGQIIGVQTKAQLESWMLSQKFSDMKKEYDNAGKYIHQSLLRRAQDRVMNGEDFTDAWNDGISHYLAIEQDPVIKKAVIDAARKYNSKMVQDSGQNIQSMMYKGAHERSIENNKALSNYLRSSQNPRYQEIADNLNVMTGQENF